MSKTFINLPLEHCFEKLKLPDGFTPTWAGGISKRSDLPEGELVALGSEDGRYLVMRPNGTMLIFPSNGSPSGEAINGIAISGEWLIATSRDDITFHPFPKSVSLDTTGVLHGSHGVSLSAAGHIIAPLGLDGLLITKPPFYPNKVINAYSSDQEEMYAYKARTYVFEQHKETLVVAARYSGLAFAPFEQDGAGFTLTKMFLDEVDMVDFARIRSDSRPNAFVAIGKDCTLTTFQDLTTDKKPTSFSYKSILGSAYRVLAAKSDLYVVTSNGLYVLAEYANHYASVIPGESVTTNILPIEMEIVDASLCGEDLMVIVAEDDSYVLDLARLRNEIRLLEKFTIRTSDTGFNANWQWGAVPQSGQPLSQTA